MSRIKCLWNLWRHARDAYSFFRGYSCVSFWSGDRSKNDRRDGSVLYRQLFGPLFIVHATEDCSTTGSALCEVDPNTITLLT